MSEHVGGQALLPASGGEWEKVGVTEAGLGLRKQEVGVGVWGPQ